MSSPIFVTMCGVPGSGKSTLAAKLLTVFNNPPPNYVPDNRPTRAFHIEYDSILPTPLTCHPNSPLAWKASRKLVLNGIRNIFFQGNFLSPDTTSAHLNPDHSESDIERRLINLAKSTLSGSIQHSDSPYSFPNDSLLIFILDDNMYHESMREDILKFALTFPGSRLIFVHTHCPLPIALTRNSARCYGNLDRLVPETSVLKMWEALNKNSVEGDSEHRRRGSSLSSALVTCSFNYDTNGLSHHDEFNQFEACLKFIFEAPRLTEVHDPGLLADDRAMALERSALDRSVTCQSLLHAADLSLRKLIGQERSSATTLFDHVTEGNVALTGQDRTKLMNRVKKAILSDMRSSKSSRHLKWHREVVSEFDDGKSLLADIVVTDTALDNTYTLETYFYERCRELLSSLL